MLTSSDIFHMLMSCWGAVTCTLLTTTTASVSRLTGELLANSRMAMLSSSKVPQILEKHQQKPLKPSSGGMVNGWHRSASTGTEQNGPDIVRHSLPLNISLSNYKKCLDWLSP